METSKTPTFPGFEVESMSSAPESHASQQVSPGSDEARKMTVGSGRQLSMLLDQSSPLGVFSKILLESLHWTNSEEYCYVWNRLDTKFACSAFQLTPLEPSTEDIASLLLPTATVSGNHNQKGASPTSGNGLATTAKLWPTPNVPNGGRRNPDNVSITGRKPDGGKAQIDLREYAIRLDQQSSGSLNPRFVEELMGFPIDHTALKGSETPSSRSKRTRSLKRSHALNPP